MLMVGVGAHQSERSARIVNGFCIAVLALAAAVVVWLPAGRTELFGGSFVVDDYRALPQAAWRSPARAAR